MTKGMKKPQTRNGIRRRAYELIKEDKTFKVETCSRRSLDVGDCSLDMESDQKQPKAQSASSKKHVMALLLDTNIQRLLGFNPLSTELVDYITLLATTASLKQPVSPEVKSYSDAVYLNYYKLGLSLQFVPKDGYKPRSGLKQSDLENEKLVLDSIYLYNSPAKNPNTSPKGPSTRSAEKIFLSYPVSPFSLILNPNAKDKDGKLLTRSSTLEVDADTSGKDFVKRLLEPDRKGGGAGPSSGSIGIWCDWSMDGIMVEFDGATGPQAWERGKDAVWKVITIFAPLSR